MSEAITTKELLDFLAKADKVSTHMTFKKGNGFHRIGIHCAWDDNNTYYTKTVCIVEVGMCFWEDSVSEFHTVSTMLDELIEKELQKEKRRQKREELLSRLTDEEKELLGVK